jgi:hypothetical protein
VADVLRRRRRRLDLKAVQSLLDACDDLVSQCSEELTRIDALLSDLRDAAFVDDLPPTTSRH